MNMISFCLIMKLFFNIYLDTRAHTPAPRMVVPEAAWPGPRARNQEVFLTLGADAVTLTFSVTRNLPPAKP